jgi:thiol-disulfide isomerase/thioredoxin
MDALAAAVKGQPEGPAIAAGTFLRSLEIEVDRAPRRFAELIEQYPHAPELGEVLETVGFVYESSGTPEQWLTALTELAETTVCKENRAGAFFAIGQVHLMAKDSVRAKAAFERGLEELPSSRFAEAAGRYIFEIDQLQAGMPAPDFVTRLLDGTEVSLESLRGKVVLLNFWASWCPTCLTEIPRLQAAVERFKDQSFEILAVSCDDQRSTALRMVKHWSPPGIQTWTEGGRENRVALLYNVRMFPTWYVLDADGVIRAKDPFGANLVPALESALRSADFKPPWAKDDQLSAPSSTP